MASNNTSSDDEDRISTLPVCILHDILFHLPVKEEARTCVLSKSWNTLVWSSLPQRSFEFDQNSLSHENHALYTSHENERGQKFIHHVEDSLIRLHGERFKIPRFTISSELCPLLNSSFFDRTLQLLAKHHLQQLCFTISPNTREVFYKFPEIALASATPLHTLELARCQLQRNSLCDTSYSGPLLLQKLTLSRVTVDIQAGAFQNFISRCHSLTHLKIDNCYGVMNLRLSNNPKLKSLFVTAPSQREEKLERIEVDSLDLQTLTCMVRYDRPLIVEATHCRNLLDLHIYTAKMECHFVDNLANNFPLLKNLYLCGCTGLGRVRVLRHPCLKKLDLVLNNLDELDVIDTPNLVYFDYSNSTIPKKLFSSNASSNIKNLGKSSLSLIPKTPLDALWFLHLKTCLEKFNKYNLTLTLLLRSSTCEVNVDELSGMPTLDLPPYIETLKLYIYGQHFVNYGKLFDGLFWICHPKEITVTVDQTSDNECIKFISEILITERDKDPGCCNFYSRKCWRHYLENVSIYKYDEKLRASTFVEGWKWPGIGNSAGRVSPRLATRFGHSSPSKIGTASSDNGKRKWSWKRLLWGWNRPGTNACGCS